jgi:hypothetical protein
VTQNQLHRPSDQLAGVCWLPRFIDKARAFLSGTLPNEYRERFGSSRGIDGAFLKTFGFRKEAFIDAVRASRGDDERVGGWFLAQRPEHEVVKKMFEIKYPGAPYTGVESVFEVIEADEGRAPKS